jgi:hypothetical protein
MNGKNPATFHPFLILSMVIEKKRLQSFLTYLCNLATFYFHKQLYSLVYVGDRKGCKVAKFDLVQLQPFLNRAGRQNLERVKGCRVSYTRARNRER